MLGVVNESKYGQRKNFLDPTNPTDGRPGLRSSTGSKGKSKGNKIYNRKAKTADLPRRIIRLAATIRETKVSRSLVKGFSSCNTSRERSVYMTG